MMKKIIKLNVLILLFISLIQAFPCSAKASGFIFEEFEEERKFPIFEKLNFQPCNKPKGSFTCFAISDNGSFALGFGPFFSKDNIVLVYDRDGNFSYGFSFHPSQGFYLDFEGENIVIYLVRSNLAVIINQYGELQDIKKVPDTPENREYRINTLYSDKRSMNGDLYQVKTFSSTLVKISSDGTETVLFDYSRRDFINLALMALCFIVIWLILGLKIYHANNRKHNKDDSQ